MIQHPPDYITHNSQGAGTFISISSKNPNKALITRCIQLEAYNMQREEARMLELNHVSELILSFSIEGKSHHSYLGNKETVSPAKRLSDVPKPT